MVVEIIGTILASIALWCPGPLGTSHVNTPQVIKCRKRMMACVNPQTGERLGEIEKRLWKCSEAELEIQK